MPPTLDLELLGRARKLGPLLQQHSAQGDRDRRLPKASVEALRQAGFFRLYLPKALGGLETDPLTMFRLIEELAQHDSAAAWGIMVGNANPWWSARLPEQGCREVWGRDPDVLTGAAFHPPVPAMPVAGGYRLTGQRPFASYSHDLAYVLLTGLVMDGDQPRLTNGNPTAIAALVAKEDVEVVDTWHSLGMRGTDSNDVRVQDAFVPEHRTFVLAPAFTPNPLYQGPLYRMPAMGAAIGAYMPPVGLGIARAALDEFVRVAQGKTSLVTQVPLRQRPGAQHALGEAEATLRAGRAFLLEALTEAWARTLAGKESTLRQKADLLLASAHAFQCAARAVELVWRTAGAVGLYERSPLERHFRDIQVLRQHGFTGEARYDTVGQVMLGLDPDLGFVGF